MLLLTFKIIIKLKNILHPAQRLIVISMPLTRIELFQEFQLLRKQLLFVIFEWCFNMWSGILCHHFRIQNHILFVDLQWFLLVIIGFVQSDFSQFADNVLFDVSRDIFILFFWNTFVHDGNPINSVQYDIIIFEFFFILVLALYFFFRFTAK